MSELRFAKLPAAFEDIGIEYFGPIHLHREINAAAKKSAVLRSFGRHDNGLVLTSDQKVHEPARKTNECNIRQSKYIPRSSQHLGPWKDRRTTRIRQFDRKFIPPGTPHQGGAWERLIRIAKRILYSMSETQNWTQESFNTFICQVEGIVNRRPLPITSADSNHIECLTPNQIVIPRRSKVATTTLEANTRVDKLIQLNRKSESGHSILDKTDERVFGRWLKWQTTKDASKCGQVVWILEKNSHKGLWSLGLVTEGPGPDIIIRMCKLQTKTGETVKSAQKLCPLECNGNLWISCHVNT